VVRAWVVVGSLMAAPVVLWAADQPLDSRFASLTATLASLANITALAGTAAFAANILIGSRIRPIVRLFAGLEAMYGAHRRLGVYAFALLAAHAVLAAGHAAAESAGDALDLFLPTSGWAVFAGTVALAGMSAALALTFFARLSHERFVLVQKALGLTFAIAALHALGVPGARSSTPLLVFLAVLTGLALSAFVCRSFLARLLARRHRYVVARVNRLDESVVEIGLEPLGRAMPFTPGQFVFVGFRGDTVGGEPHPFTIASSPRDPTLDLVVKALGDHTTALMALPTGVQAEVEGPYGEFSYLNVPNVRQVWIAGGIGITPFLSMARSIDASAYEIDLFYCTEGPEHAHFIDELYELADRVPQFRVIPVRKRSLGRISADDIVGVSRPVQKQAAVLVCGPPVMNENLTKQFAEIGVPRSQIYFEDFGFLGQQAAAHTPLTPSKPV
jgi:predicted ferric reductase